MKKGIVVLIILMLIFFFVFVFNNVQSTNLTSIKVDDIELNKRINIVDFNKYNKSNRFEEKENTYNFEEIKIGIDKDGKINYIHANIPEVNLYINGIQEFKKIEDIINVLGENYRNSSYDKMQELKAKEYSDLENKIKAKFVYDASQKLVWIILSKY